MCMSISLCYSVATALRSVNHDVKTCIILLLVLLQDDVTDVKLIASAFGRVVNAKA